MLSDEEKKEMLEDGMNKTRRYDFRMVRAKKIADISFDEYLKFLNDVQKIFSPFKPSRRITVTRLNKL